MPARSLRAMATATAIRYVKVLDDLGALPYTLARPILLRIDNPEKLVRHPHSHLARSLASPGSHSGLNLVALWAQSSHTLANSGRTLAGLWQCSGGALTHSGWTLARLWHNIELASPHFIGEDAEIWIDFIKRDIPLLKPDEIPQQSDDWYKLYCELRKQTEQSLDADAENMRKAIDGINNKRAALTPQIIPQSRSHRMAHARPTPRQRHAAFDRKMGGIGVDNYQMPREFGSKKKNSIFQPTKRNNALTVPTKALNNRASQVQRAPRALVEEHQESRRPASPKVIAPKAGSPKDPALIKNEDKLRALTNTQSGLNPGLKRRAGSPVSSSSHPESLPSGPATGGPIMRRRPPPSVFMPPKRRRV